MPTAAAYFRPMHAIVPDGCGVSGPVIRTGGPFARIPAPFLETRHVASAQSRGLLILELILTFLLVISAKGVLTTCAVGVCDIYGAYGSTEADREGQANDAQRSSRAPRALHERRNTTMDSRHREALRGLEERVLDYMFEACSSEQWAELLKGPLQWAAWQGDQGFARKLAEAGAGVGNALHSAVHNRHREIVNNLLEIGASANAFSYQGATPLGLAVVVGDEEIVGLSLRKGAEKDALDADGYSALCLAAHSGHLAIAEALLAAGADTGVGSGEFGKSALHMATEKGHVGVVRALVGHGVEVETGDVEQRTALHYSSVSSNVGTVDVLLEAGANVHARDEAGVTPLHHAADQSDQRAVLALLKHGAKVNAEENTRKTPLRYASWSAGGQGVAETVDTLLIWGADEMAEDEEGRTPANIVGDHVDEQHRLVADFEHVKKLLANAPADRAWRRRGYLTLCRAHPDRLQLKRIARPDADTAPRTRSRAKLVTVGTSASGGGFGEGSSDERRARGNWATVLARVLELQEEGLFRTIVGYL